MPRSQRFFQWIETRKYIGWRRKRPLDGQDNFNPIEVHVSMDRQPRFNSIEICVFMDRRKGRAVVTLARKEKVWALRCCLDIPTPTPYYLPPIKIGGGRYYPLRGLGACGGWVGMSSALMADAAARLHPECPFSAGGGSSRTSRERREGGLYGVCILPTRSG